MSQCSKGGALRSNKVGIVGPGPVGSILGAYLVRSGMKVYGAEQAARHNLWPELRGISVPTLFVQGEHSGTFLDAARARVEREVPGSRTIVVLGSSQAVPMERSAELSRVINGFLDQVGLR